MASTTSRSPWDKTAQEWWTEKEIAKEGHIANLNTQDCEIVGEQIYRTKEGIKMSERVYNPYRNPTYSYMDFHSEHKTRYVHALVMYLKKTNTSLNGLHVIRKGIKVIEIEEQLEALRK